jgi:hypothetical protein
MSRITYFAVLPFSRDANGDFLAEASHVMNDVIIARAAHVLAVMIWIGGEAADQTAPKNGGEWRM